MTVDKTLIAHIVAELIVISGLSFYYHKKCSNLQLQINDLNSKLEKMNGNNYLNTIKRQEQFESQTVQQINKLYSILNTMNNGNNNVSSNDNIIKESFYTPSNNIVINENRSSLLPSIIRDDLYSDKRSEFSSFSSHKQSVHTPESVSNPLMNTLSMLGPLTTMFKVVMEPKPPHPNEVFSNIDIKSELNSKKIVEIKDKEEINSEILDDELRDELDDLHSNVTSTFNTPVLTPKLSLMSNVPMLDLCENGVCKLTYENDKNSESTNEDNTLKENNSTLNFQQGFGTLVTQQNNEKINQIEQSNPLRYISHAPETKRGRPKKNQ